MGGNNNATGSLMNGGMSNADLGSSLVAGQEGVDGTSPALMGSGQDGSSGQEYSLRARALYAYNASPDDPNEISFTKGEMLDIVDNSGKWWQARKVSFEIAALVE